MIKQFTIVLLFALCVSLAGTIAGEPESSTAAAAAAPKGRNFHGVVSEVHATDRLFILKSEAGENRYFKVTDSTRFQKGGEKSDLSALTVGDEVSGVCLHAGREKYDTLLVRISGPAVKPAGATSTPQSTTPTPRNYHGIVSEVDSAKKQFFLTNTDGQKRCFQTNDSTEIEKSGAKSDFSALAVGEMVSGLCLQGHGKHSAVTVKIEPAAVKDEAK